MLLSRHGVRSPLPTRPPISDFATRPWPEWPTAQPGDLTAHGEALATLLGSYYRSLYSGPGGVLPAQGCPAPETVFAWADSTQRTIRTAAGLLRGLAPGCPVAPRFLADPAAEPAAASTGTLPGEPAAAGRVVDPLFHPVKAKLCEIPHGEAAAAVRGRIGDDPPALLGADRAQLDQLQRILGCCAAQACAASRRATPPGAAPDPHATPGVASGGRAAPCTLFDLEQRVRPDGAIDGTLSIAQSAVEDFFLEYAQGFPMARVGWGLVTPAALLDLMRLHTRFFDLAFRTPTIARAEAAGLATQIVDTLAQAASGQPRPGVLAPPGARLVALVGHDTNLAGLGGLLQLAWLASGYQPNATPPAGALVFELHRPAGSADDVVRVFHVTQTPEQMRHATPLSLDAPPQRVPIFVPGCSRGHPAEAAFDCPLARLAAIVRDAIDPRCVVPARGGPLLE